MVTLSVSQILTAVVGFLYLAIAVAHILDGRVGLGLAFAGYAFSNVGLILAEWR